MLGHHPIENPTVTRFYGTFLGTLAATWRELSAEPFCPSVSCCHLLSCSLATLSFTSVIAFRRVPPLAVIVSIAHNPHRVDRYVIYRVVGFD